jgi:hypothetical protein
MEADEMIRCSWNLEASVGTSIYSHKAREVHCCILVIVVLMMGHLLLCQDVAVTTYAWGQKPRGEAGKDRSIELRAAAAVSRSRSSCSH